MTCRLRFRLSRFAFSIGSPFTGIRRKTYVRQSLYFTGLARYRPEAAAGRLPESAR